VGADGLPAIDWSEPIPPGVYAVDHEVESDNQPREYEVPDVYQLSKYPVTYAQFEVFINDPEGFAAARWWDGLSASDGHKSAPGDQRFKYRNHPRENVSWYHAMAYCRWLSWCLTGKYYELEQIGEWPVRLPMEYEWEIAARGTDGRIYPYGGEFDAAKGNTKETGIGQTSAVGIFLAGASPYGALDMSGNVWEWCQDVWHDNYEGAPTDGSAWVDGGDQERKVLRGGSWYDVPVGCRSAHRDRDAPDGIYDGVGFRVVCGGA